jgi:ribonuclease HI
MYMSLPESSIMYLEFVMGHRDYSVYNISDETPGNHVPLQRITVQHNDYSIEFHEPLSDQYEYLKRNEKWLRSIIFTSLRVENKENFTIPFAFPEKINNREIPGNALKVYSDGSCNENGLGGWGAVIVKPDGSVIELSGSEENSTSNRMELYATCKVLECALGIITGCGVKSILLHTDSMYVIRGISHRLEVWIRNGFVTARGTQVVNVDLWEKMAAVKNKADLFCQWVESGSGNIYHERCDSLAGEQSRGPDSVYFL